MKKDIEQTSVDIQSFMKPQISAPANEVPPEKSKNYKKRIEKERQRIIAEEQAKPQKLSWFFLGAFLIAIIFVAISTWSRTPSQLVVKPNHVQRAKYKKVIHLTKDPNERKVRGYSKSY